MKIFIVSRGWPSEREPQWGSFERDQALALQKLGHQIVMLSVDVRFRKYCRKYGITKEMHGEIPHYNLFAGAIWGKGLRIISFNLQAKVKGVLFFYLFRKVVKIEGIPDIIYSHYLGNSSIVSHVKQRYVIPTIGIEHWSELGYDTIKKSILKYAGDVYSKLDKLLTVSSALRENILKNFGVDSIVVNNMVGNEFHYKPMVKADCIVHYVTTGNLLPVKGFDDLIIAFSHLNLCPDTWTLDIIGGGKEHDNLQQQIDKLGLTQNINLCGRKSREGVIEILQNSDIYVMSSRSETFGVAAIEALACGLPVIATDCGGARDFLTKENGILCPVNDVYKLSEALFQMYKCHKDYNREKIAEDCQKRFSSEAIGKQLESIFEDVIKKSKQQ